MRTSGILPAGLWLLDWQVYEWCAPEGARFTLFSGTFGRYLNEAGEAAMEAYVKLARENGMDPSQMANAFVNMQPFLTSNIIGATSQQQLKTALETHDMTLPKELIKEINKIETHILCLALNWAYDTGA